MVADGVVQTDETLADEMVYNLVSRQVVLTDRWMVIAKVGVMVADGVVEKEKYRLE